MKFKELVINEMFEFDRSGLPLCHGLKHGPWIKISARKYIHNEYTRIEYRIGAINVKVEKPKPVCTPIDFLNPADRQRIEVYQANRQ
jgi:hypothetical protein